MTRPLVFHQMNARDIAPTQLPALAARLGCRQISLFTYTPNSGLPAENAGFTFPLVTPDMAGAMKQALAASDVSVSGVEFFPITADIDVDSFIPSLALGRALGGERAVTLVFDEDRSRALDKLGRLCELASAEGLATALEFTPLTRGCTSLHEAVWFVDRIGVEHLGIGVDTLHLVRSGGSAADVAALDDGYFRYAQICDGHGLHASASYFEEAHNRELPGLGDFPLRDILDALPASITLELEVPSDQRRAAGLDAEQDGRDIVEHGKRLVDSLRPERHLVKPRTV